MITEMLIEAVFMAFVVGGIVGAAIALSLKSIRAVSHGDAISADRQ